MALQCLSTGVPFEKCSLSGTIAAGSGCCGSPFPDACGRDSKAWKWLCGRTLPGGFEHPSGQSVASVYVKGRDSRLCHACTIWDAPYCSGIFSFADRWVRWAAIFERTAGGVLWCPDAAVAHQRSMGGQLSKVRRQRNADFYAGGSFVSAARCTTGEQPGS